MYVIVWEYEVPDAHRAAFDAAYAGDGPWAALFAQADGYLGTELLIDENAGRRLTLDRWTSRAAFEAFKARFGEAYAALDRSLEGLAASERRIGGYAA